jgi:hypothetical protein
VNIPPVQGSAKISKLIPEGQIKPDNLANKTGEYVEVSHIEKAVFVSLAQSRDFYVHEYKCQFGFETPMGYLEEIDKFFYVRDGQFLFTEILSNGQRVKTLMSAGMKGSIVAFRPFKIECVEAGTLIISAKTTITGQEEFYRIE